MLICCATMRTPEEFYEMATVQSWGSIPLVRFNDEGNLGVVDSYQWLYERNDSKKEPIAAFFHDDFCSYDKDWPARVEKQFEDPAVGVVGFGGSPQLGRYEIYKRPYDITQLSRGDYYSNVTDAETHGYRFEGVMDVAVLDGFALIVRRELLDKCGGWPVNHLTFHGYDLWLCLMARRLGYKVRMCGIACHHFGGGTSVKMADKYEPWLKATHGITDAEVHANAHRWIYSEFMDQLPVRLK